MPLTIDFRAPLPPWNNEGFAEACKALLDFLLALVLFVLALSPSWSARLTSARPSTGRERR
jgi:hypothetical protein